MHTNNVPLSIKLNIHILHTYLHAQQYKMNKQYVLGVLNLIHSVLADETFLSFAVFAFNLVEG